MQKSIDQLLDDIYPPAIRKSRGRVAYIKNTHVHRLKTLTSREKAFAVVKKVPEVMLKIGRANVKSFTHICKCADYISRNGKLELFGNDGESLFSKEAYTNVLKRWQDVDWIPDETDTKSYARRLILSMPAGTSEPRFEAACREWAQNCLQGYRYVMTFHNQSNDARTHNPHCHILLNVLDKEGRRLHLNNEDKNIWREHFAVCLRKYGIEANATRRYSRLKSKKPLNQAQYHVTQKGLKDKNSAKTQSDKEDHNIKSLASDLEAKRVLENRRDNLLKKIDVVAAELEKSLDIRTKNLSKQLVDHYNRLSSAQNDLEELGSDEAKKPQGKQSLVISPGNAR